MVRNGAREAAALKRHAFWGCQRATNGSPKTWGQTHDTHVSMMHFRLNAKWPAYLKRMTVEHHCMVPIPHYTMETVLVHGESSPIYGWFSMPMTGEVFIPARPETNLFFTSQLLSRSTPASSWSRFGVQPVPSEQI